MSRSTVPCGVCKGPLGNLNTPSRVFHPGAGMQPVYMDHGRGTTTLRCPRCGHRTVVRAARIDLGRHPP